MKDDISKFAYACIKKSQIDECVIKGSSRKYYNIIRFIYLRLKEENRLGELLELLDHENPHVRVWAGAYTLEIDPKRAEKPSKSWHRKEAGPRPTRIMYYRNGGPDASSSSARM